MSSIRYARNRGMVASVDATATQVGVDILKEGGNAVDAAVAVGYALAVTHPQAGNLGGGGFMLIRSKNGNTTAIDFREMAPAKATRDMFLDDQGNPDSKNHSLRIWPPVRQVRSQVSRWRWRSTAPCR